MQVNLDRNPINSQYLQHIGKHSILVNDTKLFIISRIFGKTWPQGLKDVLAPLFHSFGNLINHVEGSVDQIRIVNACLNLLDHLVLRVVSFTRVLATSSNWLRIFFGIETLRHERIWNFKKTFSEWVITYPSLLSVQLWHRFAK